MCVSNVLGVFVPIFISSSLLRLLCLVPTLVLCRLFITQNTGGAATPAAASSSSQGVSASPGVMMLLVLVGAVAGGFTTYLVSRVKAAAAGSGSGAGAGAAPTSPSGASGGWMPAVFRYIETCSVVGLQINADEVVNAPLDVAFAQG